MSSSRNSLERAIACLKYTLACFNIVACMLAIPLFSLNIWLKAESGFNEWLRLLEAESFYIGIYILIAVSILVMASSFLGCLSALTESTFTLLIYILTQILSFTLTISGGAVLLNFSTIQSSLQPLLHQSLQRYVSSSKTEQSVYVLTMIQENIGCCGATGPWDYLDLHQPLPNSCRDAVSGNAFFNGCVDQLTWFLEEKSSWIVALAMMSAMLNVMSSVLSLILTQAIKKDNDEVRTYRR